MYPEENNCIKFNRIRMNTGKRRYIWYIQPHSASPRYCWCHSVWSGSWIVDPEHLGRKRSVSKNIHNLMHERLIFMN